MLIPYCKIRLVLVGKPLAESCSAFLGRTVWACEQRGADHQVVGDERGLCRVRDMLGHRRSVQPAESSGGLDAAAKRSRSGMRRRSAGSYTRRV